VREEGLREHHSRSLVRLAVLLRCWGDGGRLPGGAQHAHRICYASCRSSQPKQWADLSGYVAALCSRYSQDLGENAYCAFNAITDFASHPPPYVRRDRNSLQQLAGRWLVEFSQKCREPDFKISDYLCSLVKEADQRSIARAQ
jgi:hypothetical protein